MWCWSIKSVRKSEKYENWKQSIVDFYKINCWFFTHCRGQETRRSPVEGTLWQCEQKEHHCEEIGTSQYSVCTLNL